METKRKSKRMPVGEWRPVKEPGSETARAKRAGRSLHAQAEKDSHSADKRIRGKGIFAVNVQRGKFKHSTRRRSRSRA